LKREFKLLGSSCTAAFALVVPRKYLQGAAEGRNLYAMLSSLLAVGASYLVGAVPFGVIVGRRLGVDVRNVGSGNTGATNVWRALGPKAGALVFTLDILKGLAGPVIGRAFDTSPTVVAVCGVAAVIGHVFSLFLKGRGGKGIATAAGAILGLNATVGLSAIALWAAVLGLTRYISVASLAAAASVIVLPFALRLPPAHAAVMVTMGVLAIAKHIPNIQRLRAGTEPRVGRARTQPDKS
jgi:glycerol-3-phosphate acyltransferase PlsY